MPTSPKDDDEVDEPVQTPATWRQRIAILWEAHLDRERRQKIVTEWRRGAIQVLTTTAGVLAAAKLIWEVWRGWSPP